MEKLFLQVTLLFSALVLTTTLFASYNPEQGRWINRDPIGEEGGNNLYAMVTNDAVNKWDRLGLRTLMITINYNFTTQLGKDFLEKAQKEFERVMDDCHSRCDKCKEHTILYNWVAVDSKPDDLGWTPEEVDGWAAFWNSDAWREIFGFNPIGVNLYTREARGTVGQGDLGGYTSRVNIEQILQYKNDQVTQAQALGQVLAHEILFHNISGDSDLTGSTNMTDIDGGGGFSPVGKPLIPGATLSDAACQEVCDELDIDTGGGISQ